jgi:DNA-binding transcriptional regulator YiaG
MGAKKIKVTEKNFETLLVKSASQALDHVHGKTVLHEKLVSLIEEPPQYSVTKIKTIRASLGVSQSVFAKIFGESTSAIQHWEQGKRNMSKPARRLLNLIEQDPDGILKLMIERDKRP